LTAEEVSVVQQKLSPLPITKKRLLALMYDSKIGSYFDQDFLAEVEGILKATFVEDDTDVFLLTLEIRQELGIDRWVAAFHKQGDMDFIIRPSRSGKYQGEKQNDSIRSLNAPGYFIHKHNVYVADGQISYDSNPLSLMLHELSHAAFDHWISTNPKKIKQIITRYVSSAKVDQLFRMNDNGEIEIDGDVYDLLSEKYAFELEYRLNRQITRHNSQWPFSFSFATEPTDDYPALIDDYVRRHYDIDHPALKNISNANVSQFLVP
ncbi:MAG: hypothetical protein ACXVCP_03075, partial [Bdellovibrio sp.]